MSGLKCKPIAMSLRGEVLSLYKRALRLSIEWKAKNPLNESIEKDYIRSEAKRIITENKDLTDYNKIRQLLDEGINRLEVAKHYRIPYPRPVYYSTGAYLRKQK